jgi:hypothetical protein
MTIGKLFAGTILINFWLSANLTAQKDSHGAETEKKIDQIQSVSKIDGQYRIDTTMILNNKNLPSLINDIEQSALVEEMEVDDIPRFIKSFLEELMDEKFTIANHDEIWQETDAIDEDLPLRQLIYFGICKDMALMAYYTGGIAKSEHILIFRYHKRTITDFWCGNIIKDVTNKDELLKYLKENIDKKYGLNSNMIYL